MCSRKSKKKKFAKIIVKESLHTEKATTLGSSTSNSETGENVYLFVLVSSFVSLGVYVQYFLDEKRNQTSRKQKVSTRVNQKGMSRKRALDFEHEGHFPKTISQ